MAFRFVLILLILSFTLLNSQSRRFVIAPSGLNIRNAPTLTSSKIGKLKFCDTITIDDTNIYNTDTLYTIKDFGYYEIMIGNNLHLGNGDRPVIANWRKVYFDQDSGYVVDTYLSKYMPKLEFDEIVYIDKRNIMLNLCLNPSSYYWYGLYYEKGVIQVREEKVDFISGINEYSGEILEVVYSDNIQAIGIIGSKVKMEVVKVYPEIYNDKINSNRDIDNLYTFEKISGPDKTYGRFLADSTFVYQLLSEKMFIKPLDKFRFHGGISNPIKIKLMADIDNDGIDDYIIYCHTVYDLRSYALFLSSNSKKGIYILSGYSFLDFD